MCICRITHTLMMTNHTLYLWQGTYYIYGIICTVYDISPTIYDISTLYIIHQSIISRIKLNISDNTSTASLYSHPDFRSYNPHCVYDNTGTICMTSCEFIWHNIHSLWYHTTLWHSHTLYSCHHTQIPVVASTVAELLLTLYWLEHVCNMCAIKPLYVWHHMNSMLYHNHFNWHQMTVFKTSHPHYSWIQNLLYTT